MGQLYLGVDGGQSSTTALIGDEQGRVLGRGQGGPCNHVSGAEARAKFIGVIGDCLGAACRQAQVDATTVAFAAACLGFSGGAEDKEAFARELIRSERWKITHDAEIALTGALSGEPGVIVIGGTGSMAFGRNRNGETARAGGWGYLFGDEGGALHLVREALRAALRFEEGWGAKTELRRMLLDAAGAGTADELMHRWYTVPRSQIAALATVVSAAAQEGDTVAETICRVSAQHLAQYAKGAWRVLFTPGAAVAVSYAGGVFQSELILAAFTTAVADTFGGVVRAPAGSPAIGALKEALLLDGNNAAVTDQAFRVK